MQLQPPSTITVDPVTYDDASETKNKATEAISWANAILFKGVLAEYLFTNLIGWLSKIPPGHNALF